MDGPAQPFRRPDAAFAGLPPATVGALVASAADVAVVLDRGVVRDVAFGDGALAGAGLPDWTERPWAETVTVESRPKVMEMLAATADGAPPRWRQVNHPAEGGEVAVRYLALPAGEGRAVAVGRDLRATAALQQRLLTAQQAMERDHVRLREAERRYRALFDEAGEAVLVVDAARRRVVDANAAAERLVGVAADRPLADLMHPDAREPLAALAGAAVAAGRAGPVELRLGGGAMAEASASLFRQERELFLLVRLRPEGAAPAPADDARALERIPDPFVLADDALAVVAHNVAFLDLVGAARADEVMGAPLTRWLGRPGIDLDLLREELARHGVVRSLPTIARAAAGDEEVELSAVAVEEGGRGLIGMTARAVRRAASAIPRELPRSVEQLTQLVGRVSLKEIVRESTDLIERLCIEAALAHTRDNRASAAEILGLSRQSLYAKLHRHGLGNLVGQAV